MLVFSAFLVQDPIRIIIKPPLFAFFELDAFQGFFSSTPCVKMTFTREILLVLNRSGVSTPSLEKEIRRVPKFP